MFPKKQNNRNNPNNHRSSETSKQRLRDSCFSTADSRTTRRNQATQKRYSLEELSQISSKEQQTGSRQSISEADASPVSPVLKGLSRYLSNLVLVLTEKELKNTKTEVNSGHSVAPSSKTESLSSPKTPESQFQII